jgi:hypothetical protein
VRVLAEIQLERILATLEAEAAAFCVIDSIQTLYSEQLTSAPGSVAQVRECAAQLTRTAKASGCAIVLVGHVTKEGALAGPRVLEHIVDTVLYFEGDTHSSFRLVRAIKNRFGAVNEIGVFAMTERGLKGVSNPSAIFLSTHGEPVPGLCVLVTLEGTRPLLVEVQALVDSGGPSPRRLSVGLDRDRLAMLLAVLHRHAGVACLDQDVFVNAVGGVRISEPAADLAVLLAIQSSLRGKAAAAGFFAFGEVGLAGEVRPAPRGQERLKEAAKLGFSGGGGAQGQCAEEADRGLTVHAVERIDEADGRGEGAVADGRTRGMAAGAGGTGGGLVELRLAGRGARLYGHHLLAAAAVQPHRAAAASGGAGTDRPREQRSDAAFEAARRHAAGRRDPDRGQPGPQDRRRPREIRVDRCRRRDAGAGAGHRPLQPLATASPRRGRACGSGQPRRRRAMKPSAARPASIKT